MKKYLLFLLLFLICSSCKTNRKEKLTIATAANMQFAIGELVKTFSFESGIDCEVILGSSGKLTAQIKEGAPFHLFVSADIKFPADLFQNGYAHAPPKIYAFGSLVLWSMKPGFRASIDSLTSPNVRHIAMANPKTAPYGEAVLEVLKHYQIFEKVKDKLVFGESIAQTNQFITTTAAELGFTSKSVVLSPGIIGQGNWTPIDSSIYSPIAQGVIIIKNKDVFFDQAQQFYNFLFSQKGKEILTKFGYRVDTIQ